MGETDRSVSPATGDVLTQRSGRPNTGVKQTAADGDRVATCAEVHQSDQWLHKPVALELTEQRHPEQCMGGIKLSESESIANISPAELSFQNNVQALVLKVAFLKSNDQRGGVDEIDKTDAKDARA